MHAESKVTEAEEREFRKPSSVSVKQLWDNHIKRHGSLTSKIFEGLQSVQILCMGCKAVQVKHEIFSVMSLGLVKNETKLQNILIQNFQPEKFVGDNKLNCEKCNRKCDATKKSKVVHVPHVLVITLKRFEYDPKLKDFVKIDKPVLYEESDFTLPIQVCGVSVSMELFAVIVGSPDQCQTGRISSGHYYSIIRDDRGDWVVCNDDRTRKVDSPVERPHAERQKRLHPLLQENGEAREPAGPAGDAAAEEQPRARRGGAAGARRHSAGRFARFHERSAVPESDRNHARAHDQNPQEQVRAV